MDEKELLKERFKSAVSSAVKAISENFDLEIKFDNTTTSKKNSLNLPEVINLKSLQDFTNLRAFADSEALKIKYTDKNIFIKNEPKGSTGKALYAIAEKIRYEKIGSNKLKGVKNNITQCYENKFKNKKIDEIKTEADVPITEAFELYLRSHFFKIKQNQATKKTLSYWQELFNKSLTPKLNQLDDCIENQVAYSQLINDLIEDLDFEDSNTKEKEEEKETTKEDSSASENSKEEKQTSQKEEENQDANVGIDENSIESFSEKEDSEQNGNKEVSVNQHLNRKKLSPI